MKDGLHGAALRMNDALYMSKGKWYLTKEGKDAIKAGLVLWAETVDEEQECYYTLFKEAFSITSQSFWGWAADNNPIGTRGIEGVHRLINMVNNVGQVAIPAQPVKRDLASVIEEIKEMGAKKVIF